MHTCVGGFDVGGAFEGVALLSSQAFAMVRALFFLVLSNTSHPCCDECALVASMLVPCTSFLFLAHSFLFLRPLLICIGPQCTQMRTRRQGGVVWRGGVLLDRTIINDWIPRRKPTRESLICLEYSRQKTNGIYLGSTLRTTLHTKVAT